MSELFLHDGEFLSGLDREHHAHRLGARRTRVFRIVLQCALIGATVFFTVATQPAIPRVRGDITLADSTRWTKPGEAVPTDVLLIDDRTGRFEPERVRTNHHGKATWARVAYGYRVVVAHRPAVGIAVMRPGVDGTYEPEYKWKVIMLADGDAAAYLPLRLYAHGFSAPMTVDENEVTWASGPSLQWVVFAFAEGHYLVERLDEVGDPAHRRVALPPGFRGEVFAVWGDPQTERGATQPLPVGVLMVTATR